MKWRMALALSVLAAGTPVWADTEDDALKAEIQVLKDRLSRLEGQVATRQSAGMTGISSIGEKAGPALVELPSGLQGLGISGFVDLSYIYNFAEPDAGASRTNRGRVFDTQPNGFVPQAAEIVFEKPETDTMPIGFRTDLYFGDDAELTHSSGLFASTDAVDLQQAYVTAKAPIGDGLDFKLGKFVTLLGAEVIESPANWNFSRSYMFGYAIPFTHTGVLATYPLGEWGSVTGGVVNGWDMVDDTNIAKTLIGNLTLTPVGGVTLAFNGITGAEHTGENRNDRTVFDFVGTWKALDQLTVMANYDYGHESGVEPVVGTAGGGTGFDTGNWQGLALYGKYDLTPTWSLAGRWEWFDDKAGVRTGLGTVDLATGALGPNDVDYFEWTLTSQWALYEHVLARLEYRHDMAGERVFFRGAGEFTNRYDTIAAELIYHF